MKRALVCLDYDILIRHFIQSGVFAELEREYDVTYVFCTDSTSSKRTIYTDIRSLGLKNVVEIEIPRVRMGSWDWLYNITILHYQRGSVNYDARKDLMILTRSKRLVRRWVVMSLPGIYPVVKRIITGRMGIFGPLEKLITEVRPDIVFHPSVLAGFFINELLPITKKHRIPFVVLMNSWDNPTSKAMLTGHPDRLVVWGEFSKKYAMQYLRIREEAIECFGAAQFQIYRQPPAETIEEIKHRFGVPLDKKIILYAGASKGAHETQYLRMLEEGIERGHLPDCHVLYRPHPWRGGLAEGETSFFDLQWKHVTMDPHMEEYYRQQAVNETREFYMTDYRVTHRLLHMVEGVISPLSTILLEATILGKPVLMFFPSKDLFQKTGTQTRVALGLVHFTDFWGVEGVHVCLEEEEFFPCCRLLLQQAGDPAIARKLRAHASRFVVMDGPTYGERLLHLADDLTQRSERVGRLKEKVR